MPLPSVNAELTLDPKGRVMLPRLLRNAYELDGVGTLVAFANGGPRRGLALIKVEEWRALSQVHQGDPLDPKARLFGLAVASTAQSVSIDSAGRLLIPPMLRQMLGLERDLYLFTAGGWVEIWDLQRYMQQGHVEAAALWDELYGFDSLRPAAASATGEGG